MKHKLLDKLVEDLEDKSEILKEERNGFMLSLLILTSYIIQADGLIAHDETQLVGDFFEKHFGDKKRARYISILTRCLEESKKYSADVWKSKVVKCAHDIIDYTTEEQRKLLVAYLCKIVTVDMDVHPTEYKRLTDIADWLGVSVAAAKEIEDLKSEIIWTWEL